MKIEITLSVDDPEDEDASHPSHTGLTDQAYTRLIDGLADAGFSIESGPEPFDHQA